MGIKIARCNESFVHSPARAAEQVPVIHEERFVRAVIVLNEDRLSVISVISTDVYYPCEPETGSVADAQMARARQNFEQSSFTHSKETRTETESPDWPHGSIDAFHPTTSISVDEFVCDQQRLPIRHSQPAATIQIGACALIESQILPAKVVIEFDDIPESVARLHKNGLRTAQKFADKARYECRVFQRGPDFTEGYKDFRQKMISFASKVSAIIIIKLNFLKPESDTHRV